MVDYTSCLYVVIRRVNISMN